MPSFASGGGPAISTGNASWDQGLSSIFGFMDPSRQIQAGYYGAEARKAQLEGAKIQEQLANQHRLQMYSANPGGSFPPPTYAPAPGINMPVITQDPYAAGASTAPQAAAPAAASPSTPPAPGLQQPSLGAVMAAPGFAGGGEGGGIGPGPGPGPSVPIGVGPTGGAIIATPISPQQAAAQTPALVTAHSALTQGPPPPASSPAPGAGAPVVSNATGSDGSVPAQDSISGIFHPGSVMEPGGGRKQAGPAASNGSPSPIAPQLTQATYVATAVQSGQDAAQATLQWRAYIQSLYDQGSIGLPAYHQAMGSTDPSIINQDTQSRTAIATAGIQAASAANVANIQGRTQRDVQHIVTDEQGRQFNLTPVETADAQGNKTYTLRADVRSGTPGYDSSVAAERQRQGGAPVDVQAGGPGGPITSQTQAQAQKEGTPLYKGLTTDQANARMIQQIQNEPDPAKRQQLIERYQASAALPKALSEEEVNFLRQNNYQTDQRVYTQPQTGWANVGVKDPVAFSSAAQQTINQRTEQLQAQSLRLRNNPTTAHEEAVQSLIADGTLQSPDEVNQARIPARQSLTSAGISGDPRVGNYLAPGAKGGSPHMLVKLRSEVPAAQPNQPSTQTQPQASTPTPAPAAAQPPAPPLPTLPVPGTSGPGPAFGPQRLPNPAAVPAPVPPSSQPATSRPMAGKSTPAPRISTTVVGPPAPAAATAPPPGAIEAAPGIPDGTVGTTSNGQRSVVRGGWVYPLAASQITPQGQ